MTFLRKYLKILSKLENNQGMFPFFFYKRFMLIVGSSLELYTAGQKGSRKTK